MPDLEPPFLAIRSFDDRRSRRGPNNVVSSTATASSSISR